MPETQQNFNLDTAFSDAAKGAEPAPPAQTASPPPESVAAPQAPAAPVESSQQPTPQAPAAPIAPVANPLFDRAKSLGLDGFKSEAELAAALLDQVQNLRPYASYGQQLLPHSERIQKLLAEQEAPQPAAAADEWAPEKYFGEKWQMPKWESSYDYAIQAGIVVKDPETGTFVPAAGKEALAMPILPGMNAAITQKAQQVRDLFEGNPFEKFFDVLREPMQRQWKADFQEFFQQQLAEQRTSEAVSRIEKEITPKAVSVDPVTGQQVITPWGQKYFAISDSLAGLGDPQKIHDMAIKMMGEQAAPAAAPANPAAVSADKQRAFVDDALARARHSPSAGGYVQAGPHDPIHVQQAELDTMFSSEWAKTRQMQPA